MPGSCFRPFRTSRGAELNFNSSKWDRQKLSLILWRDVFGMTNSADAVLSLYPPLFKVRTNYEARTVLKFFRSFCHPGDLKLIFSDTGCQLPT